MMNRIDNILARQKKQLTLDAIMVAAMFVLAGLGLLALNFSA